MRFIHVFGFVALFGRALAAQDTAPTSPPPVPREFRAVWVATVGNIDWPSKPGLSTWDQQRELIAILDRSVALGLNAVIFQVRPGADALYASPYEPWAKFLTGRQGRAPEPPWDPLAFAVDEAHKRGLELHAWFNPYRAAYTRDTLLARTHISQTNPGLVRQYGTFLWMDPGDPDVRRRSLRAIVDVVKRYDVDGVHIDDYFYPYPENDASGKKIDFPDATTYARYLKGGGKLERDDWRRDNVNRFVEALYTDVHAVKPWVRVGISPFGIWRPGNPPQIKGFDAYAAIYADSKKWLQAGWADYFVPQLYWPIAAREQSYPVLYDWWLSQNTKKRHMWPGFATYRIAETGARRISSQEIIDEIDSTRARGGDQGHVHFSMAVLMKGPDSLFEAADSLRGTGVGPGITLARRHTADKTHRVARQGCGDGRAGAQDGTGAGREGLAVDRSHEREGRMEYSDSARVAPSAPSAVSAGGRRVRDGRESDRGGKWAGGRTLVPSSRASTCYPSLHSG